jgi:alpha-1,2-mannosyltransferase
VAAGTAAGATLLAVAVAPDASRTFWTEALWHTGRAGDLAYVPGPPRRPADRVALTGVTGCLVSPITWVHHLVWVLPALVLLATHRQVVAGVLHTVLCTGLVWLWFSRGPLAFAGANAYVWICLGLLLGLPLRDVGERQPVSVDAQAGDHAGGDRRHHRVVPELLARVDVGDVHLDERGPQHGARVPDRV